MQKGNIGVTTENIFPIIKKFLYSDHDIFLRELISNAVDATQKLKTLASVGDFKGELGNLTIHVASDDKANTITISDHGIGMTEDEINRYINQIAFSGVTDFMDKYKNNANAIIGHFGLGFYSAFMVADKVEIITKSYKDNTEAVKWSCNGTPEFTIEPAEKNDRGTDIILYLSEDCKEFAHKHKITELLKKYCAYLPVEIAYGKKTEWKDGKEVETEEDNIINDVAPIWTKKPSELKGEDYKKFYSSLYPMSEDPLFWIHLNVDFPFHLTGVLYFPKIKSNIELTRNKIQLYCNQVFVTDCVEGIVPDFLTLLHGVIDSPDIPLNVSRSYLQSDSNVKKISTYITKKVSDRLQSIFNSDRAEFEKKWDDIKLFINYGLLTQEDFYDKALKFYLLKDTEGKYYTFDEYKTLIKDNQTDKNDSLVYLYTNNKEEQFSFIEAAKNKGYSTLIMDGQLDVPVLQMFEQKFEKSRFVRVDSDVIENIIPKDNDADSAVSMRDSEIMSSIFNVVMPKIEKCIFDVSVKKLGAEQMPVVITRNEYMRRMKDVAAIQPGMSFYGEMPDMFNFIVNAEHPLVKKIFEAEESSCAAEINPVMEDLEKERNNASELRKKYEENKEAIEASESKISEYESKRNAVLKEFASKNELVGQLIDLALLQSNMLKGESLSKFIKRTIDLMK